MHGIRGWLILGLACVSVVARAGDAGLASVTWPDAREARSSMAAEFERQDAIVVAWDPADDDTRSVLARLAAGLGAEVELIVLVGNEGDRIDAEEALRHAGVARPPRYVTLPYDTIWARDYGPLAVDTVRGECLVDMVYGGVERPEDDRVPARLAKAMSKPVRATPLVLEGGNLLTNGHGTFLTSYGTPALNGFTEGGEEQVANLLAEHVGATQVVFLEPLIGEPTSHVDMFATFVSADTVVVGSYDPAVEPVNAEVLDRNAKTLEGLETGAGRLKVVRVPMPAPEDGIWFTYTNVVYANGRLLVPTYADRDDLERQIALATYRRLLPKWTLIEIESSHLIGLGGGLHCVTSNLPSPSRAKRAEPVAVPKIVLAGDGGRTWRDWQTLEEESLWDLEDGEEGEPIELPLPLEPFARRYESGPTSSWRAPDEWRTTDRSLRRGRSFEGRRALLQHLERTGKFSGWQPSR